MNPDLVVTINPGILFAPQLGGAQFVLEASRPKVQTLWCGAKKLFLFNFLAPHNSSAPRR